MVTPPDDRDGVRQLEADRRYMRMAIDASKQCVSEPGRHSPMVGAIVVREGQPPVAAYRGEQAPGDHAEFTALEKKLGEAVLAGATVYTTLEPCTTRGHPKVPCADRLVERKVARVVIGMLDPNPAIQGKGYQLLRDHNIATAMFPPELAAEVEDLNRHFRRAITARVAAKEVDSDFVTRFKSRPLDEWYRAIGFMYAHRNFERSAQAVLAHLVEVIGGLSLLASGKQKPGVVPEDFLPKSIAWWLALCAKVGITSVADLLWVKYPRMCPYCRRDECDSTVCRKLKREHPNPNWEELRKAGKRSSKPQSFGEWQRMFRMVYKPHHKAEFESTFARLCEEIGELAEAVRVFPAAPGYFISEAADVFAWLMNIQNNIDFRDDRAEEEYGSALEERFCRAYPDYCKDCTNQRCACAPILESTIGRLAHDAPHEPGLFAPTEMYLSREDATRFRP